MKIEKYGNLHFGKINKKLTKCIPALKLLFLTGFKKSKDDKRLIWTNTKNNFMIIKYVKNALQSNTNDPQNDNSEPLPAIMIPQTMQVGIIKSKFFHPLCYLFCQ